MKEEGGVKNIRKGGTPHLLTLNNSQQDDDDKEEEGYVKQYTVNLIGVAIWRLYLITWETKTCYNLP